MTTPTEDCAMENKDTPRFTLSCANDQGHVGTLRWDEGVLKFEGKADESAVVFMKYLAENLGLDLEVGGQKYTPAINTSKRLFDLVRYMRSDLHEAELITDEEYAWLCGGSPMAQGSGSPSPRRLEDYDRVKDRMHKMAEALAGIRDLVSDEDEDPGDAEIARMQELAVEGLSLADNGHSLYVVGEDTADPQTWSQWSECSLVVARNAEEAKALAESPGAACCRIPLIKPRLLMTRPEPRLGADL